MYSPSIMIELFGVGEPSIERRGFDIVIRRCSYERHVPDLGGPRTHVADEGPSKRHSQGGGRTKTLDEKHSKI